MKFIGREKEKMQLSELINSLELSTGLIYGRRRVGKSELVKHVLKEHESKSFYFECKQVSQENNTSSLADMINKPLQQKDVEEEIAQVKATSLDCYRFGFISRSGFEFEKQDDLILIDLKELFDVID